jgi:hypothetical protein
VFFISYVNSVKSKIDESDLICAPCAPDIFSLYKRNMLTRNPSLAASCDLYLASTSPGLSSTSCVAVGGGARI